jgi:hypothetical protein
MVFVETDRGAGRKSGDSDAFNRASGVSGEELLGENGAFAAAGVRNRFR